MSGGLCLRWGEVGTWITDYPDAGLSDHNYCRNPNSSQDTIWCMTSAGTEQCEPMNHTFTEHEGGCTRLLDN